MERILETVEGVDFSEILDGKTDVVSSDDVETLLLDALEQADFSSHDYEIREVVPDFHTENGRTIVIGRCQVSEKIETGFRYTNFTFEVNHAVRSGEPVPDSVGVLLEKESVKEEVV